MDQTTLRPLSKIFVLKRESVILGLFLGQGDYKLCSGVRNAPGGDFTAVAMDDFLANGEADAAPFIVRPSMQALKWLEDALDMFLVKPDAVVLHRDRPQAGLAGMTTIDGHKGRNPLFLELQGIRDQVLEELAQ